MELKVPEKESELESFFDREGNLSFKKKENVKRGKKSKAAGSQFELRVRKELEERGWIVDKWSNNLDLNLGKIVPVKRTFIPFKKGSVGVVSNPFMGGFSSIGVGFPDFIAMQKVGEGKYKVIGVEVKINGTLSREEKLKAKWYMENEIFAEFLIAKKVKEKNKIRIEYTDFKKMETRMR